MWHIKTFSSPFCTIIRDHFWGDVIHVDNSDEKRVQKGHKLVHILNPAVWHIIATRISWATIFYDQSNTDIVNVVNSDDPWYQSCPPLGVTLKYREGGIYKIEGSGLFAGTHDSNVHEGKALLCLTISWHGHCWRQWRMTMSSWPDLGLRNPSMWHIVRIRIHFATKYNASSCYNWPLNDETHVCTAVLRTAARWAAVRLVYILSALIFFGMRANSS